jgi:hypothetical protein
LSRTERVGFVEASASVRLLPTEVAYAFDVYRMGGKGKAVLGSYFSHPLLYLWGFYLDHPPAHTTAEVVVVDGGRARSIQHLSLGSADGVS